MTDHAAPPPDDKRRVRPIDLFGDGNYRRLWLTGGFVGIIRWLELLTVSIYVFEATGSALQTALMTFFRFLPMVLFGAVIGAIAERMNRRSLMLAIQGVLCVVTTLLGLLAMSGTIAIWQIAIGVLLGGAVHTSEFPVRRTMLGEIAGPSRAEPALAYDAITNNLTRLIGPLSGGIMYDQVGLHGAYFLCATLYAAGFLLTLGVHYKAQAQTTGRSHYLTNIVDSIRFIRRKRIIVGALAVTILINMFATPFAAMIPVIGRERLELSASLIGVLASSEGVGAFGGGLLIAILQPANFPRVYVIGSFLFLVGILAFALSGSFIIALAILLIAGLGHAGFSTTQTAIMYTAARPEMRSRVLGVLATSIGALPIGVLHLGLLADWLGAPTAVAVIAVEGLVLLAVIAMVWPELIRGERPPALSDKSAK